MGILIAIWVTVCQLACGCGIHNMNVIKYVVTLEQWITWITQRRNLIFETHPAQMLSRKAFNWHTFRDGIRCGVCKHVSCLMSQKVYIINHEKWSAFVAFAAFWYSMFPTLWDKYGNLFNNNDGLKTLIELINTRKLTHFISCLKKHRTILLHLQKLLVLEKYCSFRLHNQHLPEGDGSSSASCVDSTTGQSVPKVLEESLQRDGGAVRCCFSLLEPLFSLLMSCSWPTWFHNFICQCWWSKRKLQSSSTTSLYLCILNGLWELFWSWCNMNYFWHIFNIPPRS